MSPTRRFGAPLLAATLSIAAACSGGKQAAVTQESPPPVPAQVNPMEVDYAKLRLDGPGERVLVRARGRPYIRTDEYNAWLGSYPLNITESDALAAQTQALDQMVNFRMLLERAIAAGYESKSGVSSDPPSIVFRYVADQVRNASSISDAEARRYYEEHRDMLRSLDAPEVPAELRMAAWKSSVRGAQLAAALEQNRKDANVEILLASSGSAERNEE